MPSGGHNVKSHKLKILEGRTNQGDSSPKPRPTFPVSPPRGLPKHSRAFWKKYAPVLDRTGTLTEADVPAWTVLCNTWNTICQADQEIADKGLLIPGARGNEYVKNPAISILNAARQQFRLQCQAFGLDPFSRERLGVAVDTGEVDPMEELLSKPRGGGWG